MKHGLLVFCLLLVAWWLAAAQSEPDPSGDDSGDVTPQVVFPPDARKPAVVVSSCLHCCAQVAAACIGSHAGFTMSNHLQGALHHAEW